MIVIFKGFGNTFLMQDSAMKLWLSKGAPAHKLMLGIPFYGRSFTLTSPHQTKPGSASSGAGHELHYTVEEGFIAYYEACKALKDDPNGWTVREDEGGNPYAFKGDQWFGYDDPENVVAKVSLNHSSVHKDATVAHGHNKLSTDELRKGQRLRRRHDLGN